MKKLIMFFIILFVAFFAIAVCIPDSNIVTDINVKQSIENKFVEIGYDKSKIKNITKTNDWANGPRYKVSYEDETLYVYAFDNNEIAYIRDKQLNFIYENKDATGIDEKNIEEGSIVLIDGQIGEYGVEEEYDSEMYIRYYIPAGQYTAKALIRNTGFYIEKKEIYKNSDGFDESETVKKVTLAEIGAEENIVINDDECIALMANSSISVKECN